MSALAVPTSRTLIGRPASVGAAVRVRWDRVAGLLLALLLAAGVLASGLVQRSQAEPQPAAAVSVVVQPGDTIYDLALLHAPEGVDTLSYAALVARANGVDARRLVPGSVLLLPRE